MDALYGIDTVLRIVAALALLFVVVPRLAWKRPADFGRLEWFWWNFGVGITVLTLAGQAFTLLNVASAPTYLLLLATIVVLCRAKRGGVTPAQWVREAYRSAVRATLQVFDDPDAARERLRARASEVGSAIRAAFVQHRAAFWAWSAIVAAAVVTRLYRPFATANLGFSDTYVHLYLMRLLDEGRQVDPAWGPYPRGMHFLLLAIDRLTNADPVVLVNFFGGVAGVLLVVAVAYAARRVTRSTTAALLAGLVFATMIGGARQYFAFGGSVSSRSAAEARQTLSRPYAAMADAGEFDVLFTTFQRQTSTLSQELAIVLLLPAALFLLDWMRRRNRWRLAGFVGCTAAIGATHSGVLLPLAFLCAAAAIAVLVTREASLRDVGRGALAGIAGIAIGSTWMLGFLWYRSVGGRPTVSADSRVGATALYYFPFLRAFTGGTRDDVAYMTLTPFLIAMALVAIIVALVAIRSRASKSVWIALAMLFFLATHAASMIGAPELIEVRRNATWLAMTVALLLAVAVTTVAQRLPRAARIATPMLVLILWLSAVPNLFGSAIRARLLDYSGYGGTASALLRVSHELEPFTWTFVGYGQEYPMVLGRGFHMNGIDFLESYNPAASPSRMPTPHVFIAVEKTPHHFEINSWSTRFRRADIEHRLGAWCARHDATHHDLRVFFEDEHVRVYRLDRPAVR